MPLLSIITINLNNRKGLSKTIKSVIKQTYRSIEYIIIDGGSEDGSIELIESYAARLSFWSSEKDSGVYEAMNKGVLRSRGNYLLFLNSGDFLLEPTTISQVFAAEQSADILLGRCHISKGGEVVHITDPPNEITFGYLYNIGLNHQSTFIKGSVFEEIGPYDEGFKYNADIEFWYRSIILNGVSTVKIAVNVCDYNLDGMSTKESHDPEFKKELEKIHGMYPFPKFIPDYEAWNAKKKDMKVLYWVKTKPLMYSLLQMIYSLARLLSGIRKNIMQQLSTIG